MDQPVDIAKIRAAAERTEALVALAKVFPVGRDVVDRLMTDERADTLVWPEFRRWALKPGIVERLAGVVETLAPEYRPETYPGISEPNASVAARQQPGGILKLLRSPDPTLSALIKQAAADRAICALFAFTVIETFQTRPHGTVKDVQKLAQPYRKAAAMYRSKKVRDFETAARIDRERQWMVARAESGPFFTSVRRSPLGERHTQFCVLTAAVHALYGMKMPVTTGTLLAVALGIPSLSKDTVDGWSRDLAASVPSPIIETAPWGV